MINVYCTFDKVSEEYSMPWFAKNDNVAKRNLLIASRRENLPLEDITLYFLGSFDSDSGLLVDNTQGNQLVFNKKVISLIPEEKENEIQN